MKAGTETGSLVNHLYSRGAVFVPALGEGATILHWTDRTPATVVEIIKAGKATIVATQDDDYKRTDSNGMSDCQAYEFSRDPNGNKSYWKLKGSKWVGVRKNPDTGRWVETKCNGIAFGFRSAYYDFSF